MHILETKDAECSGWSAFIVEVVSVQGIVAFQQPIKMIGILAKAHNSTNNNAKHPDLTNKGKAYRFFLKPVAIPAPNGNEPANLAGKKALCQGGKTVKVAWPAHCVVRYPHGDSQYYYD